ncbi:transcription initiation factor TFIID subunit 8-like [Zingiber officinale]|uniref:Transcription initiation factor TFIID subunit 8 n=1 Tax=Zingiber officinale TaxID=94328 RepID=A0A8J5I7G6_ZINOF|nr:transcription initiation factor TFIID subunit 8-like [Zingiber officinale]KAG6528925.1 hypothetical protein ZIOFF_011117 [Zingiber officinale]
MSDGGKESERDHESRSKKDQPPAGCDEFGRAVAKVAVAQICESVGLEGCNLSAIDAFSEVVVRYIYDLGKSARSYANLAGRADCNVFDVIQSLEDLSAPLGFSGASDIHHCLVGSSVAREITQYVNTVDEVPFAKPIPKFPISRLPKSSPSFAQAGLEPAGKHIPDWLPRFPDPHTYVHTPVWNKRATDAKADKIEQARQRRKAERSLLGLQQRLASNAAAGFQPINDDDTGKGKQVVASTSNPFLAPPLTFTEKEVSEVVIPCEMDEGKKLLDEGKKLSDEGKKLSDEDKKLTAVETFAPIIEAVKSGSLDLDLSEKKPLLTSRPTVHFKIGVDKKSIASSLIAMNPRKDAWPFRDEEKDDKKKRAEMILREAMEKPHDLAQL